MQRKAQDSIVALSLGFASRSSAISLVKELDFARKQGSPSLLKLQRTRTFRSRASVPSPVALFKFYILQLSTALNRQAQDRLPHVLAAFELSQVSKMSVGTQSSCNTKVVAAGGPSRATPRSGKGLADNRAFGVSTSIERNARLGFERRCDA